MIIRVRNDMVYYETTMHFAFVGTMTIKTGPPIIMKYNSSRAFVWRRYGEMIDRLLSKVDQRKLRTPSERFPRFEEEHLLTIPPRRIAPWAKPHVCHSGGPFMFAPQAPQEHYFYAHRFGMAS